jgi:hypothetical protein
VSEIIQVSSDWLALREHEDARARSRELALTAAGMLESGPIVVHDLGSGTGSMMRWMAPILPGPQTWILHDWNAELVERAAGGVAPLDREGRPVAIRTRSGELAHLAAGDLDSASLVTASALLDVLTTEELHALVQACVAVGCPVLLSLSVTGEVRLDPADPRDGLFEEAFNAHQRRHVGGRPLLGPTGGALAQRLFVESGWKVRSAATFWRLGDHDPRLLDEWFDGWVDAASEQLGGRRSSGPEYRESRTAQRQRGDLCAVLAHTDLLAWP